MTDPLMDDEITHWLSIGAPDGWSWPLGMNPWDLVERLAARLVAVNREATGRGEPDDPALNEWGLGYAQAMADVRAAARGEDDRG